jgi:hypothetical protein
LNENEPTTRACTSTEARVQPRSDDDYPKVLGRTHAHRSSLERFISKRYALSYGARIEHFADHLVGVTDADGGWTAAVGFTPAGSTPLFIEQYLDIPIEQAIAERLGVTVDRSQVVEVGNLAATVPGAARRLVVAMTRLLHQRGHTWVAFTSTAALLNTFARLDVSTIQLAPADPSRLHAGADAWGTYYETRPLVMAGSIPIELIRLRARLDHASLP